jgi:phage FluMu protein Com
MNDRIRVQCGACDTKLAVPGTVAGKKVRCPKCKGVVAVPAPTPQPAPAVTRSQTAAVPKKKKRKVRKRPGPKRNDLFSSDEFLSQGEAVASSSGQLPPRKKHGKKKGPKPRLVGTGNEAPKGPKRVRQSFSDRLLHGGVITGILTMIGAAAWFLIGLAGGVIFFYPPILFIIGLVTCIKGLLDD